MRTNLKYWLGLGVWCALAACGSTPATKPANSESAPPPSAAVAAAAKPQRLVFGAALGSEPPVDFAALLSEPNAHADHAVQVEGVVRQVCQSRGCWLELATALDPAAPGCRVVLKDHAFFVPIDSAGSRARLAGIVQVQNVSAAQVAHMEHEGGRFANKHPDGSASEIRIVASGVELARL